MFRVHKINSRDATCFRYAYTIKIVGLLLNDSNSVEWVEASRKKGVKTRLVDVNATFSPGKPSKNSCKWQQNFIKIIYNFTNLLNHSNISSSLKGVEVR